MMEDDSFVIYGYEIVNLYYLYNIHSIYVYIPQGVGRGILNAHNLVIYWSPAYVF